MRCLFHLYPSKQTFKPVHNALGGFSVDILICQALQRLPLVPVRIVPRCQIAEKRLKILRTPQILGTGAQQLHVNGKADLLLVLLVILLRQRNGIA